MTTSSATACPFGVLNVNAVAETMIILQDSPKDFHAQLHTWLKNNYLEENIQAMCVEITEPLGRRIQSISDLSLLVCAYSNARALKQKTTRRGMDHELYFYGHVPDRDAAVEAGLLLKGFPGP